MSDRTFERAVLDWLEDGSDRTPSAAIDAVLLAVKTTPQQRVLRIPWRFLPMPVLSRATAVATVAIMAVVGAGGALLIANRSPGPGGPSPTPTMRAVAPTAIIDLAADVTGTIPVTAEGDDVWIGVNGAVIHVNGQTNAQTRIDVPSMRSANGGLLKTPDGLWVADYAGNRLRLVDPTTGAVELETELTGSLGVFQIGTEVWVTSALTRGAYAVNPATGQLGPKVGTNFLATLVGSPSQLWDAQAGPDASADQVVSLDPTTGSIISTITTPQGTGCGVDGTFPANIWAGCTIFQLSDPAPRPIVRIDPATSSVAATVNLAGYAGVATVMDGVPWFIVLRTNGGRDSTTLVAADPATGRVIGLLDLGELSPDIPATSSSALWIPDEQGRRVVKYSLSDLKP